MSAGASQDMRSSTKVGEEGLRDAYGRVIDYLRMSVTDACNLRCVYCMPLSAPEVTPGGRLLTIDEYELLARAATSLGFRKFRLTGGEPTVRRDIVQIVERIASVPGVADLAMTTNALRMGELAAPLKAAGLRRVNIHVDTLDAETLPRLMRWGDLERIRAGIEACEAAGLTPIKLNVVVVRGFNDEQVGDLAALTLERDWHVRFIELMPLGASDEATIAVQRYVSNVDSRARVEASLGALEALPKRTLADECENFRAPGGVGVIGFISPVSQPYCGTCNRMRLTADGRFHLCLLNDDEVDVRAAVRSDGDMESRQRAVEAVLRRAVEYKPTGHRLDAGRHTRGRRMHQIGG